MIDRPSERIYPYSDEQESLLPRISDLTEHESRLSAGNDQGVSTDLVRHDTWPDPLYLPTSRKVAIILATWTGMLLVTADLTLLATISSSVSSSFSSSNESTWLATADLLATTVTSPLYGTFSDLLGRKFSHLIALSFFLIGTLVCGISQSMSQLIIGRLIAGCGGGGVVITASIILADLIPLKDQGVFHGLMAICCSLGSILGGMLGGFLIDHLDWRFAFLVQIPFLIIAIFLVSSYVNYRLPGQAESKAELLRKIDYEGCLILIIWLGSFLLALSLKNCESYDWSDPRVWGTFMVSGFGLISFVYVESRVARNPVLPLRIFRMRSPFCLCMINFTCSMTIFSVLYMYPLWLQTVKLKPNSDVGLNLIPFSISTALAGLSAGAYINLTGRYKTSLVGLSLLSIFGAGVLVILDRDSGSIAQWFSMVPAGASASGTIAITIVGLIASVDRADTAVVTCLSYLSRYAGQVVGVALSGAILQAVLAFELEQRITGDGSGELIDQIRHSSALVKTLPPHLQDAAVESYSIGLRRVFGFDLLMCGIGFVLSLGVEEFSIEFGRST